MRGRAAGRGLSAVLANEANLSALNVGHTDFGDASGRGLFEAVARNNSLTPWLAAGLASGVRAAAAAGV